jgi:hypothetical protein
MVSLKMEKKFGVSDILINISGQTNISICLTQKKESS